MLYDLHVHSTASDGLFTPRQIIDMALKIGLAGLALTDHDTVDGLESAIDYIREKEYEIDFIPGIEINTEVGRSEVHILGYFIDYRNTMLNERLKEIKRARSERAIKMIDKLRKMGLIISLAQVKKLTRGDLIGRPHIARALMEKAYVFSEKEAFEKYIGQGKPAYVPRYRFLPEEAIDLVKNAGGIPVLAHPGLISDQDLISGVIDMGIEGIEIYYPEHDQMQIKKYIELARKNHLVITGGSDFHGTDEGSGRSRLGITGITQDLMRKLLDKKSEIKQKK
jgi:hypothetical protein